MLLSMTGYGRATHTAGTKTYTVEIRSLNSKQNDLRLRSGQQLHKYEMELRRLILERVKRGKLEVTVEVADASGGTGVSVNTALLNSLYKSVVSSRMGGTEETDLPDYLLKNVDNVGGHHANGLYAQLLRVPGVIETGNNRVSEDDWAELQTAAAAAVDHLDEYRRQEGAVLADDLAASCRSIADLLTEVQPHEGERIGTVRARMEKHLADFMGRANVDKNRYEQEVLFYLEKMDINEEKVRLRQNCDYFLEILANDDRQKGRKLNFISQEIGREINTLGAKAYSAAIQKLVVNMKEHLEMIKEQLANVA